MKNNDKILEIEGETSALVAVENGVQVVEANGKEQANLPAVKKERKLRLRKKDKEQEYEQEDDFDGFPDLARIMNMTVKELREEFFLFQVRKLMSKLAKTVIRFSVSDKEIAKLFHNAKLLEMDEIVVAPAFLPACVKQVSKLGGDGFKVGSIIDFPFGESSIKSKLGGVKECVKQGVDDVTVMMPSMLVNKDNLKQFRKQSLKIGKAYKGRAGIALNATDLDEEQIKLAVKSVSRSKLAFITFVFGTATFDEVQQKMTIVKKYKEKQKIFALANVDTAEGIMALFTNGVDKILTPYADQIGEELVRKFRIKSIKLK